MKSRIIVLAIMICVTVFVNAQKYETLTISNEHTDSIEVNEEFFHTSICYDLLCDIESIDELTSNNHFNELVNDTAFISAVRNINSKLRGSNLCNFVSISKFDKNSISQMIDFFNRVDKNDIPTEYKGKWVESIFDCRKDILLVINKLVSVEYEEYWTECVLPILMDAINAYGLDMKLVERINNEINLLAGSETISEEYHKIYILNIDNAFNLVDDTFCSTYYLLNPEIAKQYRINFIQVFIHENLHRINLSTELMNEVDKLLEDDFYRKNENIANSYGEGKNEAFVVAAEEFISHKLGLKDGKSVYNEFKGYCDGSLVLAPIIYLALYRRPADVGFNKFLLKLFENGTLQVGEIEHRYYEVMDQLKAN